MLLPSCLQLAVVGIALRRCSFVHCACILAREEVEEEEEEEEEEECILRISWR